MTDAHRAPGADRPGSPASGYQRMPADPGTDDQIASGPDPDWAVTYEWAPRADPADDARLAPWALFAAIVALATSMFVGWGLPVAIVAVIAAIMALRRAVENREMAVWSLVLGLVAALFSSGWLVWAAMQFERLS